MKKLDDGTWHTEGFEKDLPPDDDLSKSALEKVSAVFAKAGAHIAVFLKWSLLHGDSPLLDPQTSERVRRGELSATQVMEDDFDWKLLLDGIPDAVRPFASAYYGFGGLYPADIGRQYQQDDYGWTEKDVDFEKIVAMIEQRRAAFDERGAKAVRKPALIARFLGVKPEPAQAWR